MFRTRTNWIVLFALLIALCACGLTAAADVPEGYPAIRIDPATGEAYDFGGATIYIYDYWSGPEGTDNRESDPDERTAALYAYRDWLMATYNCHIVQKQAGDWGSQINHFNAFVAEPDGSYRLYIVEPGSMPQILQQGTAADWNSDLVDLTDDKWNTPVTDLNTIGGSTYGVAAGKSEPRQLLFFNKRVLTEAGVNWNSLYDMQAAGTWTWEAFVNILRQVQRDTDGDDVADIFGLIGNADDFYRIAVFSNGGCFFSGTAAGGLTPAMDSDEAISALNWARNTWATYAMAPPDGSNWDWYKEAWKQGQAAFYMYQAYGGFNDNAEFSDMTDPWGAVAFPIGPSGDTYVTIGNDNVTVLPAVYDEQTAAMLAMIYDLWTMPVPGYEDDWIGSKLDYTDERAVLETFGMLREPEHVIVDRTYLLGTINDVLGMTLLWQIGEDTPVSLIDGYLPVWTDMCELFNEQYEPDGVLFTCTDGVLSIHGRGPMPDTREWSVFSDTATQIVITGRITSICDSAFEDFALVTGVTIPETVTSVGANAFSGCTSLTDIAFPIHLTQIGANAFSGCTSLTNVTLPHFLEEIGAGAFSGCTSLTAVTYDGAPSEWAFVTVGDDNAPLTGGVITFLRADKTPLTAEEPLTVVLAEGDNWFSFVPEKSAMYDILITVSQTDGPAPAVTCELLDDRDATEFHLADAQALDDGCALSWHMGFGMGYYFRVHADAEAEVTISLTRSTERYWYYDGGVLFIGGDGPMDDYDWGTQPWYSLGASDQIWEVVIEDGVTSIGRNAFSEVSNLQFVLIPDTVTSIGDSAFSWDRNLRQLEIPASVTNISSNAFYGLENCTITVAPDNPAYVTENSAIFTKDMTRLIFAFGSEVTIPAGVTSIDAQALDSSALTSISVDPDNQDFSSAGGLLLNKAGDTLVKCPAGMYDVEIPEGVTGIAVSAFDNCAAYRLSIPTTLLSIPSNILNYSLWNLSEFVVAPGHPVYSVVNGMLLTDGGTRLARCPAGIYGSAEIPDSVTVIGDNALESCYGINWLTIPARVTEIGYGAFQYCDNLTDIWYGGAKAMWDCIIIAGENDVLYTAQIHCALYVILDEGFLTPDLAWMLTDDGVLKISGTGPMPNFASADAAPWFDFKEQEVILSVVVEDGVTTIGDYAFYNIMGLSSVSIGQDVTYIGKYALAYNFGLTGIALPSGLTEIGEWAFDGTTLTAITIPDSVTAIGEGAFHDCRGLADADGFIIIRNVLYGYIYNGSGENVVVTVPAGVTHIGALAFANATQLTGVILPDGLLSIGQEAFSYCPMLESCPIPDSVTEIGEGAFKGCNRLADADGFVIVDHVVHGFYGEATDLQIPEGVTGIAGGSITDNYETLSVIRIPAGVTSIGIGAFAQCYSLTEIQVSPDNPAFCSVDGALYDKAVTKLIACPIGKASLAIPDTVTVIGESAVNSNNYLSTVTLPAGLTRIEREAFASCGQLTSVSIPDSVTSIGIEAFAGCWQLGYIEIPAGVTEIGESAFIATGLSEAVIGGSMSVIPDHAFAYIGNMNAVTITAPVTRIGPSAFECCTMTGITLPATLTRVDTRAFQDCHDLGLVIFLGTREQWSQITFAEGNGALTGARVRFPADPIVASGTFGDLTWSFDEDGLLTVSGTGAMPDCNENPAPWSEWSGDITSVVIGEGVTRIGSYAFAHCSSLSSVTVGSDVTFIGGFAFAWDDCLWEITLPVGLTEVDNCAFGSCTGLNRVYYDGTQFQWAEITVGDDNNFLTDAKLYCSYVATIILPADLTVIESQAFTGLPAGTAIRIADTVISIAPDAFDPGTVLLVSSGSDWYTWAEDNGYFPVEE